MKKKLTFILLVICVITLHISCSSPKALSEITKSAYVEETVSPYYTNPKSDLIFSFKISKSSMSDSLDLILDSLLIGSLKLEDSGVTVAMSRVDSSRVKMIGQTLEIGVPLNIVLYKSNMFGTFTAAGQILMKFKSDLDIDRNWNLISYTKLESHDWIKKPRFRTGIFSIPITRLTNAVINRTKTFLTRGIDESLKENFSLREYVDEITDVLLTPYKLDSTFGGWIYMMADSTFLAPAQDVPNYSCSKFYAPMYMKVQTTYPFDINNENIAPPIFSWKEAIPDSSKFRVRVDLRYDYLTELAKQNFLNRTFKNGSREVKIEDLVIYGDNNLLKVACKTSGSFKGNIVIGGTPDFKDNILQAKNISLDIKTKNLLYKTGSFLAKGFIRNELNKILYFDITDYLQQSKEEIELKLSELKESKNITVNVDWGKIDINSIQIKEQKLDGLMEATLKVDIIVDDLKKLSSF